MFIITTPLGLIMSSKPIKRTQSLKNPRKTVTNNTTATNTKANGANNSNGNGTKKNQVIFRK